MKTFSQVVLSRIVSFLFACLKSIGADGMYFYSGACEAETTKESIKTKTETEIAPVFVLSKVLSLID